MATLIKVQKIRKKKSLQPIPAMQSPPQPVALKHWVKMTKKIKNIYSGYTTYEVSQEIDDSFCGTDHVDGLKTTLFPHQKPIIQTMVEAENNRKVNMSISDGYHNTKDLTVYSSACVLSEPVGSGKTIDVLGLILKQKFPKAVSDISEMVMCDLNGRKACISVVRKRFKNILCPTIIFSGVSVIDQWVLAIKKFTSLRYFAVYNVRDLQLLIDMMISKKINQYDVVVVKNGKVTRKIKLPSFIRLEHKNKTQTPYIYNIIANIRNFCWARVVVDDFDTIKLPPTAGLINGLFTWYISSTKKNLSTRKINNRQHRRTSDMLLYADSSCGKIMQNTILFQGLNIRNKASFIERTNHLPAPKFFAYTFTNPNDRYMGLLGAMNTEQTSRISEMLNADAFETAADAAGVKLTSVADIFQKILGEQFENYETSIKVMQFISQHDDAKLRQPYSENPDQNDTYNKKDLLEYRVPKYNYSGLRGLLNNTLEEYTEIHTKSGVAIQRVKDNISEGDCPICYIELKDVSEDSVILKCCSVVLCSTCCFGAVFPNRQMYGQCSNCRQKLVITDTIYLNSKFNLDSIIQDRIQDDFGNGESVEIIKNEKPRTKMDAILDIINGDKPKEQIAVDVSVHNLMKGRGTLPETNIRKVLIFASFEESLRQIEKQLKDKKIDFWLLKGGRTEITSTAQKFQTSTESCVLLISATKHCAGLNLQSATDLIFAHKILDKSIESQVCGRIFRMGATTQAKIHFMLYKNEFEYMKYNNQIREL
jgi:SNF2 family DNA or RNA helicase